jgi:hypothetical protein
MSFRIPVHNLGVVPAESGVRDAHEGRVVRARSKDPLHRRRGAVGGPLDDDPRVRLDRFHEHWIVALGQAVVGDLVNIDRSDAVYWGGQIVLHVPG